MAIDRVGVGSRDLRTLYEAGGCAGMSDADLIARFLAGSDEAAEAAFAGLVERHGPAVLRACRATLRDRHDAEDAFQATFLVLALKARTLAVRGSLGPWLYRVARHVAARSRSAAERRRRHERLRASGMPTHAPEPDERRGDVAALLHEELDRLPSRFRTPLVLCHLEGRTCEEAAGALGLPVGTVKSRLARGRGRLRTRLAGRGLTPSVAVATLAASTAVASAVPPRLASIASQSALAVARVGAAGIVPQVATSLTLAHQFLRNQLMRKILTLAASVSVASVGLGLSHAVTVRPTPAPALVAEQQVANDEPTPDTPARQRAGDRARRDALRPKPVPRSLVAPRELVATSGHGEALMYALDDKGERIVVGKATDPPQAVDPALAGLRRHQPRPGQTIFRETLVPLRWAVVVGTFDFRTFLEAMADAPRDQPFWEISLCRRIDLQRQVRRPDGSWSGWIDVDSVANLKVLDNLPEYDRELSRADVRFDALVDPLPFLKSGTYCGVDVDKFLDRSPPSSGPVRLAGELMVRAFDFTVEPGRSYRYRARFVSIEPKTSEELFGPWSEPTGEVSVE